MTFKNVWEPCVYILMTLSMDSFLYLVFMNEHGGDDFLRFCFELYLTF